MHNKSTISSSNLTTQPNLSKCTTNPLQVTNNSNSNSNSTSTITGTLTFWPPSAASVDALLLKLKAKDEDTDSNWEKTILNFKKEIQEEEERLNNNSINSSSGVDDNGGCSERREKVRAKFCVPLSRREMEKDFEDMGERRLPRKPKKRPKVIQNQLDTLFPGLWLTEIHADLYRVSETKKR